MRRRRTGTAGGPGLRLLLLLLLGLSVLSGCGQKSVFSLDPEEISRIAVYTGGVPADAQRKETENAGEVERIVRILNGIRVRGKASYDDVPAGGIGIWFEVLGKDGQTSVARVLGDGDLLAQGAMLYRIAAIDPEEIGESLDAPSETVGETGLPSVEVTDREQDTAVAQYSAAEETLQEEGNDDGTEETAREENTAAADFAVRLLRETLKDDENREGNLLLSPASVLQALGLAANGAGGSTLEQMEEAFDPVHADFSGIGKAGMGELSLGSVQHRTFLEVNEKGTRAAAATAAGVMAISAGTEREIKEIRLDRPFVCMIVDMETGCPLFLGVIRDVGEG